MTQHNVLVTGGLGGIGTAIVSAFAAEGYKVAAVCAPFESGKIDAWQAERKAAGATVSLFQADVADFGSCEKMAADISSSFGQIDVLVNCAGIIRDSAFKKMSVEQWDMVLRVNLFSVFNVTRQFWNGMLDRGYGRIVNIASVNGQKGQFGQANYAASKAGMHGLTMSLAQEGARHGITVNSVSPGYTATEMMLQVPAQILEDIKTHIPMRRLAKPEEIAAAVTYLASDHAGFITGVNLDVNGGQWMHH